MLGSTTHSQIGMLHGIKNCKLSNNNKEQVTRKNYSRNFTSIEGLADYSLSWDQKTGEKKKKTEDSNSNYGETAQRRTNVQSKIDEKKKKDVL